LKLSFGHIISYGQLPYQN